MSSSAMAFDQIYILAEKINWHLRDLTVSSCTLFNWPFSGPSCAVTSAPELSFWGTGPAGMLHADPSYSFFRGQLALSTLVRVQLVVFHLFVEIDYLPVLPVWSLNSFKIFMTALLFSCFVYLCEFYHHDRVPNGSTMPNNSYEPSPHCSLSPGNH